MVLLENHKTMHKFDFQLQLWDVFQFFDTSNGNYIIFHNVKKCKSS